MNIGKIPKQQINLETDVKKRIILISAVLIVIVAVGLFLVLRGRREIVLAQITPPGALLFVEFKNLENNWERLTASNFWKELLASTLWRESGWGEGIREISRRIEENTGIAPSRQNVMQLIGRDVALALIYPEEKGAEASLLLLSRVGLRARAIELVTRMGVRLQRTDKRVLVEEEYGGRNLVVIKPSTSFPFYAAYTFLGDYLALTLSQDEPPIALKKVIDLVSRRGEASSLAGRADWRNFKKFSLGPGAAGNFFLKFDRLFQSVGANSSAIQISGELTAVKGWNELKRKLRQLGEMVEILGGEFKWEEELEGRLFVSPNRQKIEEIYGKRFLSLWDREPVTRETTGFVPSGSIFYLSVQSDFALLWEGIKKDLESLDLDAVNDFLAGLDHWEEEVGLRVEEDILDGMGREAALVLEKVTTGILLPLPELAFIFKIENRDQLVLSLEKIAAWLATKYRLTSRKQTFAGVEITTVPLLVLAQPAYAFLDDYLLVSSSRDLLRRIIDIRRGEEAALTSDAGYQKVVAALKPGGSAFAYLNNDKLGECILQTGNWWLGMQKLISSPESKTKEDFYQKKLIPFLNLLKVFKASGWKKSNQGDVVIQDFYWNTEDKIFLSEKF